MSGAEQGVRGSLFSRFIWHTQSPCRWRTPDSERLNRQHTHTHMDGPLFPIDVLVRLRRLGAAATTATETSPSLRVDMASVGTFLAFRAPALLFTCRPLSFHGHLCVCARSHVWIGRAVACSNNQYINHMFKWHTESEQPFDAFTHSNAWLFALIGLVWGLAETKKLRVSV